MSRKRYEHDCEDCVHLLSGHVVDIYYCKNEETFILRYGNECNQYTTLLKSHLENPLPMNSRRDRLQKLLKRDSISISPQKKINLKQKLLKCYRMST